MRPLDSCSLPLTLEGGFKSMTLFKDMLNIFPEYASEELRKSLDDGIPVSYLIHLITNPFDWGKVFEDLADTFILFFNIVNEEANLTPRGRVVRRHAAAMARSVTVFGNMKVKNAKSLVRSISARDLDYFFGLSSTHVSSPDSELFLETLYARVRRAMNSLNLQNFTYNELGSRDWAIYNLILTFLTVNLTEETDTEYFKKVMGFKHSWIRIRKLVALYYTAEQREALLTKAYGEGVRH